MPIGGREPEPPEPDPPGPEPEEERGAGSQSEAEERSADGESWLGDDDLGDLDPAFVESLEGLPAAARAGFIGLERESMAAIRSRESRGASAADDDALLVEFMTGARFRELVSAQQVVHFSIRRRDDAVRAARAAGYSWAQLARVVGVSRQALHRRFRDPG